MSRRTKIDFGNGIVTGQGGVVLQKKSGFHFPELENAETEYAMGDGGVLGISRGKMRLMTVLLAYTGGTADMARAFSPNIERRLTTSKGWIPYKVHEFIPADDPLSDRMATVVMKSQLAYPLGEPQTYLGGTGGEGGLLFPFVFPAFFESIEPIESMEIHSLSEVICDCRVTAQLNVPASLFTITINGRVTRVEGELSIGDIIVIDSATSTVTVNGVNRLSWFNKASDFPQLDAGFNYVDIDQYARLTLEWTPRLLGLV